MCLFHFERELALPIAKVFRKIHFLPLFQYFQNWVCNMCNISNKSAQKKFYTRHLTLFLHGIIKYALSIAEFEKHPLWKYVWISQIIPSSKKYWRKLETVCPYIFLIVKVFANFNTWAQDFSFHPLNIEAYFSFITSFRNIANVVLGSINWFSSKKVAFVMRMCLKMMFLFPK